MSLKFVLRFPELSSNKKALSWRTGHSVISAAEKKD
jgi:hypothetical protein